MTDRRRTVRVDVSQGLLCEVGSGPPPRTRSEYVQRLVKHRRQFAQIAAVKYEKGDYRTEVRVLVIEITQADLGDLAGPVGARTANRLQD